MVNAEYSGAMRRRGFRVVDPSLALQQRKDCRKDYMHSHLGVYVGSTWRMLLAALASLHPEAAGAGAPARAMGGEVVGMGGHARRGRQGAVTAVHA